MTIPANLPGGLFRPREIGGGRTSGLFSTRPFLHGDEWIMFMPGQSSGFTKEKPSVMPAPGSLPRVPKTVFLTSCPPAHLWGANFTLVTKWTPFGYFGHWNDAMARDTRYTTPTINPYGSLVFDGFTGQYSYMGWSIDPQYPLAWEGRRMFKKHAVVPNLIVTEHYRLVAEFQAAKAILEAKYPNQVFVQVCEFFPNDPVTTIAPEDELSPKVLDVYTPEGRAHNAPKASASGPIWLLGPDKDAGPEDFFGSNFLHIYCGYQSDGPDATPTPTVEDLRGRFNWPGNLGYKLDTSFNFGFDQWIAQNPADPFAPDGYEGVNVLFTENYLKAQMTGEHHGIIPTGDKLTNLQHAHDGFRGYKTVLHEYDLPWSFGGEPDFTPQGTTGPCGPATYYDQDWVEQTIIIGYLIREALAAGDPDQCFGTGGGGLTGDGNYNLFEAYPSTLSYTETLVPQLRSQWSYLKTTILDLAPKTVQIWNDLFAYYGLADLGFEYGGGSSTVTSASIVAYVESHYGLTP